MTTHPNSEILYSIVLKLAPERQGRIRATHGHHAHAAFLRALRQADPALAEAMHRPQTPVKPFTVSPLLGLGPGHEGTLGVSPERDYFLRFTVLYAPIFEQFMGRFLRGDGRPWLQLGQMPFHIKEILTTPGSHPWSGYRSFVEMAQEAAPAEGVTLQFTTPTAFSFGKRDWGQQVVPLPVPRLVFGSLARSWNALAPPALHLDRQALRAYVEDNVVVAGMRGVRTRMLAFRDAPQLGFVGRVTFEFKGRDETMRCQLNALAELAFYAGVGYKTTMGMGQCKKMIGKGDRKGG
jgi:CRISPR-associated endoribonuclease Cas6